MRMRDRLRQMLKTNITSLTTCWHLEDNDLPSYLMVFSYFPLPLSLVDTKGASFRTDTNICGTLTDRCNYLLKELCRLGTRRAIGVSGKIGRLSLPVNKLLRTESVVPADMHHYAVYIKNAFRVKRKILS